MAKLVENTISNLNLCTVCTKQATLSNHWFRMIFFRLDAQTYKYKIPVALTVNFDIER